MLHFRVVRLAFLFLCCSLTQGYAKDVIVSSPNGSITVTVGVKDNKPYYWVKYYNELTVSFQEKPLPVQRGSVTLSSTSATSSSAPQRMNVVFRVFDDGVGFRYILPTVNKGERFCIQDELTEITLAHDAKAWSIPTNHTEYFEGIYNAELLSRKDTVCTPLTIEYEDSIYLAIHEAALEDYASINLTPVTPHLPLGKSEGDSRSVTRGFAASPLTLRVALSPWQNGVKVYCQGETKSPWRTVIIPIAVALLIYSHLPVISNPIIYIVLGALGGYLLSLRVKG